MTEAPNRQSGLLWPGLVVGVVAQVASWVWVSLQDVPLERLAAVLAVPFWVSIIGLVAGIVLVLPRRTRRFGGGLLLGLGAGLLIAGGVCAVLAGAGGA